MELARRRALLAVSRVRAGNRRRRLGKALGMLAFGAAARRRGGAMAPRQACALEEKGNSMDGKRFDRLAKGVSRALSRRTAFAAGAAVVAMAAGREPAPAQACKADGAKCASDASCCSGFCKKRRKRRQCAPAPGAFGCTVQDDSCNLSSDDVDCPGKAGGSCFRDGCGKPICGVQVNCNRCSSDQDCIDDPNAGPGSRCLLCPQCGDPGTAGTTCIKPVP